MTQSKTKLLELINNSNFPPVPLTEENVELLDVQPATGGGGSWNTRVTAQAVAEKDYTGSRTLFYRRLNLSLLDAGLIFSTETVTTAQALLDQLNTVTGAWLDLQDLETFVLPTPAPSQSEALTLIAKADSFGWTGQLTVTLQNTALPLSDISISDALIQGAEGSRVAVFTISIAAAAQQPVQVNWTTAAGTALAGEDFTAASGVASFTVAGPLTQEIQIALRAGDQPVTESFTVVLSNPTNGIILDGTGECVIPGVVPVYVSISDAVLEIS